MVPESLCSFVLCTNMSGSLFSSPEQTAQASSSSPSSSLLAGLKVPWDCFLQTQSKERTGGTGIDLALINHCTMIHDCCQAVDLIYGPPAVECGYRSSSWTSAAGKSFGLRRNLRHQNMGILTWSTLLRMSETDLTLKAKSSSDCKQEVSTYSCTERFLSSSPLS